MVMVAPTENGENDRSAMTVSPSSAIAPGPLST
jgi:hypothetical protein